LRYDLRERHSRWTWPKSQDFFRSRHSHDGHHSWMGIIMEYMDYIIWILWIIRMTWNVWNTWIMYKFYIYIHYMIINNVADVYYWWSEIILFLYTPYFFCIPSWFLISSRFVLTCNICTAFITAFRPDSLQTWTLRFSMSHQRFCPKVGECLNSSNGKRMIKHSARGIPHFRTTQVPEFPKVKPCIPGHVRSELRAQSATAVQRFSS
jgi:hypothetical protein